MSSSTFSKAAHFDSKVGDLKRAAALITKNKPTSGWLKVLRTSLGLSAAAMGRRLGITQQSTQQLEDSERQETITLASLRRAAAALDAELVYAIVPRRKLQETISARAREVAKTRVDPIAHSMGLEAQGLTSKQIKRQIDMLARELEQRPRELWR